MQPVFCNILIHNRLQYGPYDNAKRAVLYCETHRFTRPNGPFWTTFSPCAPLKTFFVIKRYLLRHHSLIHNRQSCTLHIIQIQNVILNMKRTPCFVAVGSSR